MSSSWPLRTERLTLRPVAPDDLDAIWAYRSLPDVGMWLGGSRDRENFDRRFLEPKDGHIQLTVLLDGDIAGDLMLQVRDAWSQRDVAGAKRVHPNPVWSQLDCKRFGQTDHTMLGGRVAEQPRERPDASR